LHEIAAYLLKIIEVVIFFWLIANALTEGRRRLLKSSTSPTLTILIPMISGSLQAIIFLLMINLLIPELGLTGLAALLLEKLTKVLLIATIGWIFFRIVNVMTQLIVNQYTSSGRSNDLSIRKVNTQVMILKRVVLAIGFVVTLAAILMSFDSVKSLGTGLLTTAGVISAVGAFASQQSLSRLFAGLQIAFTQPIRIGDTVVIDSEQGDVEQITLSYIVVKLWDLRRLIIPTDYFIGRSLLNLSRDSTELLGTVFLHLDYTVPMDALRAEFNTIVAASSFWNGKVKNLQVTDLKENYLELRALVSADNSGILWNLRCEVREKLLKFILDNYPDSLAKIRNFQLAPMGENS
jgi:small-conductance mechanosensitive channel